MKGMAVEGLFRISPSQASLQFAITAYDRGHPVDLRHYGPHVAASLIKQFMSMLPMPIFPAHIYPALTKFPNIPEDDRTAYIQKNILGRIDSCAVILLDAVIGLLAGMILLPIQGLILRRCICCCADENASVESRYSDHSNSPPSPTRPATRRAISESESKRRSSTRRNPSNHSSRRHLPL
jgi:hypothetical protein